MTPGHTAYEADLRQQPRYHDGTSRRTWEQLSDFAKWSWERNPTPRTYRTLPCGCTTAGDMCEVHAPKVTT